jgi:adenylate cyclase class 2
MASELSSNDQEVEAKYRVGDLDRLIAALGQQGVVLSEPSEQDDQAYAPVSWSYGMSKIGVTFARLRTEQGRHLFTVKRPIDNEMACLEHESAVSDREAMHAALVTMGWAPTVRIRKARRTGSWNGVSVCVDVVDQLGAFFEVERMVSAAESGGRAQAELDGLVRSLGVDVERVSDTYDSLIRNLTAAKV